MRSASTLEPARSLWLAAAKPGPAFPALARDIRTDVAIVGGGYTGLAAAHHLAAGGIDCSVLEAHDIGWGASGRNGGMAVLRYKTPWASLARALGDAQARHLHRLLLDGLDLIEAMVEAYRIDCGFRRCGHVTAANGRHAMQMLERDVQWLGANGDRVPCMLNAAEVRALSGAAGYAGGYHDPRAAAIQPLDYVRGLAAGVASQGVPIFTGTRVQGLREEPQAVVLETGGAVVRASQVLVATNAYTDLSAFGTDLGQRVVAVSTSAVSTAPLPADLLAPILPGGEVVSDTRHLLNWFRRGPGDRIVYGGRASLTGQETPAVYGGLERKLVETFPELAGVPIEHRWSGKVAVTLDDFPHVGRASARVLYAMGYGGRGVVLTSLLGKLAAQLARGEAIDAGPMGAGAFARIPLQQLRIPAMQALAGYYGLLDMLRR